MKNSTMGKVWAITNEIIVAFFACLATGAFIGAALGLAAARNSDVKSQLYVGMAAAILGGVIGSLEGLFLYLLTRKHLSFGDYRRIATISLVGGQLAVLLGGFLSEVEGMVAGMFITPFIALLATCLIVGERVTTGAGQNLTRT